MKKIIILSTVIVSCLFAQEAQAQKVKYKDLFPLLSSKNYTIAEPLLKTFLKSDPEHANAHFQMALLYDYKAGKTDVLKEKALLNNYIDSATFFYKKAATMITEKEVKKNEEFYQAYNRRDLRTGKFEIKVSDIQLEIEKAIKNLENKRTGAQGLNINFDGLQRNYKASAEIFNGFADAYPDVNKLYLRANTATIEKLNLIVQLFDSVHFYQKAYATSLTEIKTSYNQSFVYEDLEGFSKINTESTDFYAAEVKLDDFGDWASKSLGIIETDIARLKKALIDHNVVINSVGEIGKIGKGEFPQDKMVLLEKYDKPTFFTNLFELNTLITITKMMEDSILNKIEGSWVNHHPMPAVLLDSYTTQEKLSGSLLVADFNSICSDYDEFITSQYKGCQQFQEYLNKVNQEAKPQIAKYDSISKVMVERIKWSITGTDSIALFAGKAASSSSQTIGVLKLAQAYKQLVIGVKPNVKKGSNVFLALVSGGFTNEWLTEVDTKGAFMLTEDSQGAALMEGGYETYLGAVYSKDAAGVYKTCLILTDAAGKLKWTINHSLPFPISKIEPSTELAGYKLIAPDGTFTLIDPTGKIRQ